MASTLNQIASQAGLALSLNPSLAAGKTSAPVKGQFDAQVWQDGKTISTLQQSQATHSAKQSLALTLAPSGGAVAVFRKK